MMRKIWSVILLEAAKKVYPLVERTQEWIHTWGVPGMRAVLKTPTYISGYHTALGPAQGTLQEQADINWRRRTGRL